MKMYNYEIESFVAFLMTLELAGQKSRMRTKFVKLALDHLKEVENDRIDLIKEYVELDENNDPKTTEDENGLTRYEMRDIDSFKAEYDILMSEKFVIENLETNRNMLDLVKDAILNTNLVFKGQEALQYDRWCEICEGD